jgi:hypothetical protein
MIGRLYEVVIDCPDPVALGAFYRELTGLEELLIQPDWVTLGRGKDVRLAFQKVPEYRQPRWPDPAYPQQSHIDVFVTDLDDAEAKVLALGASRLSDGGEGFRVYADPAGHPFCLCVDDPSAP